MTKAPASAWNGAAVRPARDKRTVAASSQPRRYIGLFPIIVCPSKRAVFDGLG
jgi:hypothetical protein